MEPTYSPEELQLIPDRGRTDPLRFKRRLQHIESIVRRDDYQYNNPAIQEIREYLDTCASLDLTDW